MPETPSAPGDQPGTGDATQPESEATQTQGAATPPAARRFRKEWVLLLVAVAVAVTVIVFIGRPKGPGSVVTEPITLISSDRDELACAASRTFGRYRCEFDSGGAARPAPVPDAERLVPVFTVERQMYLVPNLFSQSAVAARCNAEPPAGRSHDALKRFTARCELKLLERVGGAAFEVRWQRGDKFGQGLSAWVAEVIGCKVDD
jgi:hypothetical protein